MLYLSKFMQAIQMNIKINNIIKMMPVPVFIENNQVKTGLKSQAKPWCAAESDLGTEKNTEDQHLEFSSLYQSRKGKPDALKPL